MTRSPGVALVAVALTLIAACSGSGPSAAPASVPGATAATVVADDPPGALACKAVIAAMDQATFMTPGVVGSVQAAAGTADAAVADAAQRLADAYAGAVAAHDTPDEPDRVAAVSAAAAEMVGVCRNSGLDAVG